MVWQCRKCGTINYDRGGCGCCGHDGTVITYSTGTTSDPLPEENAVVC